MKSAKDFYKFLKTEKTLFAGAHDVYTPQPLIEEILNQIDLENKSILVMFNIEFVISLVYTYKVNPDNITFYADHENKIKIAKRLDVKYITELKTNMKFDVVLANPPYQDDAKNPLYYKFHNLVVNELLKPNGITAFITPDSMAVSLETGTVKGCHTVEQREIVLLNISTDIKKIHFKDVGINNFCYYIVKNTPKTSNIYPIVTSSGTRQGTISPLKPLIDTPLSNSILNKCFNFDTNYYGGSWNTAGKSATKNPNGKDLVVLNIDDQGNFVTYPVSWNKTHKYVGIPKLFITGFGNRYAIAYDHNLVCAVEKCVYTVPTKSDSESERLAHLLDCDLKKFLTIVIKARGPYIDFVRHFRGVPLTKKWSNNELFKYFNLTKDEIDYIKTVIK